MATLAMDVLASPIAGRSLLALPGGSAASSSAQPTSGRARSSASLTTRSFFQDSSSLGGAASRLRPASSACLLGSCLCHPGQLRELGRSGASKAVRRLSKQSAGPRALLQVNVDVADKEKLESMKYRRNVFTMDDWKRHRSAGRHFRHLQTILYSRVISALGPPVALITGLAVAVTGWNESVLLHLLPEWAIVVRMPELPFSLTAPALSFLLVFRTNASYGRFDEARKMWGLMLNRLRDASRQALVFTARGPHRHEEPKQKQFMRHLQAFPFALKHHLIAEGDLREELETTDLTAPEINAIMEAKHRPNYVLLMAADILAACHIHPSARINMDQNLTVFADVLGGCERIYKTPIPLSYTRLTSRFLIVWHIFLPLGLWNQCHLLTVPVSFLCAAVFFCVEEVGVVIEEPFSILALAAICNTAKTNIDEMIGQDSNMKSLVAADAWSSDTDGSANALVTSSGEGEALQASPDAQLVSVAAHKLQLLVHELKAARKMMMDESQ
eukprot:jgi/Mesen1/4677/ME000241S03715